MSTPPLPRPPEERGDAPVPFEKVMLERLQVAVAQKISREFADTLELHRVGDATRLDYLTGELTFLLSGFVLAHHRVEARRSVGFIVPATWWQHAKLALSESRRIPGFARRRLHVGYRHEHVEVVFTEHELLPQAPVPWPKKFGPVFIRQQITETRE